jgi:integrase
MVAALRAMMNEAVIEGHVAANPVEHLGRFCRITKGQKVKIDPLGLNELHRVEAKCAERFPEHYGLLLLLARTGMRFGEVVGLQWQDVDEHRGQLLVRRNMARHRQAEAPKTPASERRVDLSPEMLEELKRLRRERRTQIFKAGREWNEEEWIFRNKRGRPIIYADFHSHVWTGLLRLAGLRHRGIHQLRHSWASHMLASGADLAYVAAQLGHSSPAVTLEIYTHWVPGTARVTAAIFDRRNANEMQTQTEDGVRPEQERQ